MTGKPMSEGGKVYCFTSLRNSIVVYYGIIETCTARTHSLK